LNNGARKGGEPETLDVLKSSPGFQGFRQSDYSEAGGEKNALANTNGHAPAPNPLIIPRNAVARVDFF